MMVILFKAIRVFSAACLATVILSTAMPVSSAPAYTITQLTNNDFPDGAHQINNRGEVVWIGGPIGRYGDRLHHEVFLFDGTTTTQLTNDDRIDQWPNINDAGWVVWYGHGEGEDSEVFLYDGSVTVQLTDNDYPDWSSHIGNNGHVVWLARNPAGSDTEIMLYDEATVSRLTDNDYDETDLQVNNKGDVVWSAWPDSSSGDAEIFLYDGTTITQLTDNDFFDGFPRISDDSGVVCWRGKIPGEIFQHGRGSDATLRQLTDNDYIDFDQDTNRKGYVVWVGTPPIEGANTEIFLSGLGIQQITHNSLTDEHPRISDSFLVTWHQWGPGIDSEIFIQNVAADSTDTAPLQLTDNEYNDFQPEIANNGCVAWIEWDGTDNELFRACPDETRVESLVYIPPDPCEMFPALCFWREWARVIPPQLPDLYAEVLRNSGGSGGHYPPGTLPANALRPCPECSFSNRWVPQNMPPDLPRLYQATAELINGSESRGDPVQHLMAHLKNAPTGQRYNAATRDAVLRSLKASGKSREKVPPVAGELLEAVNSLELDWRVPQLDTINVNSGKNIRTDFQGVSWATFQEVEAPGKLTLNVSGYLPAVAEGLQPGWPLASYRYGFTGKVSGTVDVGFYFGGQRFAGNPATLRLFQWDGKAYRDITSVLDLPAQVIRGRTDRLSTFVIMNSLTPHQTMSQHPIEPLQKRSDVPPS